MFNDSNSTELLKPQRAASTVQAGAAFVRLTGRYEQRMTQKRSWKPVKLLSSFLYACETDSHRSKMLNCFHLHCLRWLSGSIVGLRWWDKVPDSEVLKQAEVASISTTIMTAQLRWLRYEKAQESLPKRTAYGKSAKRGGWCKHCYLQLLPKRFHVELHDSFRTALLDLAGLCRGHLLNHTNISVTSGICSCSGTNRSRGRLQDWLAIPEFTKINLRLKVWCTNFICNRANKNRRGGEHECKKQPCRREQFNIVHSHMKVGRQVHVARIATHLRSRNDGGQPEGADLAVAAGATVTGSRGLNNVGLQELFEKCSPCLMSPLYPYSFNR